MKEQTKKKLTRNTSVPLEPEIHKLVKDYCKEHGYILHKFIGRVLKEKLKSTSHE